VPRRACTASQVAASSIRAVASPPANIAVETRVSSVRSEKSHEVSAGALEGEVLLSPLA